MKGAVSVELQGYCTRCRQPFTGAGCPRCDPPAPAPLGSFQVWHRTAFLPLGLPDAAVRHLWRQQRSGWLHVADVRAPSWEAAFDLTNTYDEQDWYTRAAVTLRVDPADPRLALLDLHPLHSTSVGDVLVAGDWVKLVRGSGWLDL